MTAPLCYTPADVLLPSCRHFEFLWKLHGAWRSDESFRSCYFAKKFWLIQKFWFWWKFNEVIFFDSRKFALSLLIRSNFVKITWNIAINEYLKYFPREFRLIQKFLFWWRIIYVYIEYVGSYMYIFFFVNGKFLSGIEINSQIFIIELLFNSEFYDLINNLCLIYFASFQNYVLKKIFIVILSIDFISFKKKLLIFWSTYKNFL